MQQIAAVTGLNRVTVHSIVEKFESMQIFLRTYEGKRRRITPVDPQRLRSLLEREQEQLQGKLHAFEKIAPQLSDLFLRAQRGLEVYTLHGEEGLIFLCEDVLTCEEEVLEYANIELLTRVIGPYLLKDYLPKKHKLQRRTKFLFVRTPAARQYIEQNYIRMPHAAPMQAKFIDRTDFNIDANLVIYGEKIALFTPSNMQAVIIKDRAMSDSLRPFFNFVWERAGKELSNY